MEQLGHFAHRSFCWLPLVIRYIVLKHGTQNAPERLRCRGNLRTHPLSDGFLYFCLYFIIARFFRQFASEGTIATLVYFVGAISPTNELDEQLLENFYTNFSILYTFSASAKLILLLCKIHVFCIPCFRKLNHWELILQNKTGIINLMYMKL